MRSFINFIVVSCFYFAGTAANTGESPSPDQIRLQDGRIVYKTAESTKPIKKGSLPDVTLKTENGDVVTLRQILSGKPTLILFYRGGWCPYCNRHLKDIQKVKSDILAKGYKIVAITPDRPEKIKATIKSKNLDYKIYSDSNMSAAIDFGLAFQIPDSLVKTYKEKHQIDVEDASGKTHHLLPVPAAYLVNKEGRIRFAYANPDYKQRVSLEALKAAL